MNSRLHNNILPFFRLRFNLPLKPRSDKLTLELQFAEHCNLNCACCSHFSPVAEPEFLDVEEYKRDIARMGEIFSHECEQIRLLGGEPLLHPEINTLLKITRENFLSGKIEIVTNGLLLLKMGDEFWRTCHDNNINIYVTYYLVNLDTEGIHSMAKKFGVALKLQIDEKVEVFRKDPIDLAGKHDIRENFAFCVKRCVTLQHGKLYNCSFTPHVQHFNKAFGQNVEITEADYLDIYSNISKDEILDWVCKPVPACRYCSIRSIQLVKWHVSKREMSEWV